MACGMSTHCPRGGLRRGERLLAGLGPPPPACLITVGLDAADEFRWPLFCPSPCVSSLFSRQLPLLLYGKKSHLFFQLPHLVLAEKNISFALKTRDGFFLKFFSMAYMAPSYNLTYKCHRGAF